MKRFLAVLFLSVLVMLPTARAEGPDDDYVTIYGMIQQGDALTEKGDWGAAITKYVEAQGALKRFQKAYPDAYLKVVKFRLNYLANKIEQLSSQAPKPATNAQPPAATNAPPPAPVPAAPTSPAPATAPENKAPANPTAPPPSAEMENKMKALEDQVRHLEADRSLLEAKLKEALAARPAEVDPQELAKAREQITSLQKENELLKANLESAKTNSALAAAAPADLEKTKQALAEANRKVSALTEANATLAQEKEALQTRMKTLNVADPAAAALREENELLKKQVAQLKKGAPATPSEALDKKLQEAQAQIAAMQSDKEILRLEKIALENRVRQLSSITPLVPAYSSTNGAPAVSIAETNSTSPEMSDSVMASKIAQLEAQRDELQKSLEAATRDAAGRRKGKEMAARLEEMSRQLAALRARIQTFDATRVPYTSEELALFSTPGTTLMASAHSGSRKTIKEPSGNAEVLLAEGRRYFVAHEFDKAEAKYAEALKLDPKNVGTLSDLASIQLEEGRAEDAEKNLKAALAIEPEDDYSLFVLGQLKFRQKSYDEAFDALSRAAQLNPQNARIQNSLGLTLSEKGYRGPAETAFRKAIQLDPGFADAHINLAVVYATQQPPLLELARWHYQKALATGHAANTVLEKLLEQGGQSVAK
ncbi:MAG TPA: tetratricopeptide repeat protein [Verrucomicrobiae bacterium]|nr:tetratricopeptide repeat protein [Verrucomicrobiae bacterium]